MTNQSRIKLRCRSKKRKKSDAKMLYHCNLICVSPKHGMHKSWRCLKILYIYNCWNLFFVPEPMWNSDNQKLSNFKIDFFYRSVNCNSPGPITFCSKIILLPFGSHCSTQNIGYSNSRYIIKPPQPSSALYRAPQFLIELFQQSLLSRPITLPSHANNINHKSASSIIPIN